MIRRTDRWLWVWLSWLWAGWRSALIVVKPETVLSWHRKGFRLYWTWKIRRGRAGRPRLSKDTRDLIRTISRMNVLWGAPRIHSELRKLGIKISEATPSTWCGIQNRRPRRGERSLPITCRNWCPSTSSLCARFRSRFCLSSSYSPITAGALCTLTLQLIEDRVVAQYGSLPGYNRKFV
jgi:hypothetical protein